jgi:iron(III) transport system substrate-binding protein
VKTIARISFTVCLLLLVGCTHKNQVWIYTSMYKEVVAEMKPELERALPGIQVRWYQGGSETVAARINTELVAGRTQADLVLTSDPFWYLELKKSGKLQAYDSPAAREVPAQYADPDHFFTTVRMCLMVLGYNPEAVPTPPATWRELKDARWRSKLSMGSPVESGTMFTATAMLARAFGWDWFVELRASDLIAAGGNGSVINRMETHERPVGMVLLENILKAQKKGSPLQAIYPSDGAIAVPSPIALMADSRNPALARQVYDWFFSQEAQAAIVRGSMYSPLARMPAPEGGRPWSAVSGHLMKWDAQVLAELYSQREQIKNKFNETVIK